MRVTDRGDVWGLGFTMWLWGFLYMRLPLPSFDGFFFFFFGGGGGVACDLEQEREVGTAETLSGLNVGATGAILLLRDPDVKTTGSL